ncbi:MAG: epoxyalkane--coenzyme M transferase, partial [Hyphomicrobiaceae bacterium]|nr:epoxyalkane--coenzyme M transferase [Hyphomicrobiaceae bacterium]
MTEARILTTHAGSLPRPAGLTGLFTRRAQGETIDEEALAAAGREAVASVLAKQRAIGIDVVSN